MIIPDYKDLEGTRMGIFDVLECINPDCNEGSKNVKYRVKCSKCGYEKIVSRQFLITVNHYNNKACEKCKRSYMIYDFKKGEVCGKYKILDYVGLGNNSMRIYRVKCMKCGWEGDLLINSLLNSMKSKNITCCHKDNHATSLKIGETVNERYLIVGKFINQNIFKDSNFRYIVKCTKCNKLLYLTSDKMKRCVRSPKCSHKAYFNKEKFNKDDYIIDEKLITNVNNNIKEDTMVIDKFVEYVINNNKELISKKIQYIIMNDEEFLSLLVKNAKKFLSEKLTSSNDEDLDNVIKMALESKEFKESLIKNLKNIPNLNHNKEIHEIEVKNPIKSESKKIEVVNNDFDNGDVEFNNFVKSIRMYRMVPGNKTKELYTNNDIKIFIGKGNIPRILEKAIKIGLLDNSSLSGVYKLNIKKLEEI